MIKIDIEGAGMAALEGMRKIIEKNPELTILTEYSSGEYLNELIRCGFKLFTINEKKGEMTPIDIDSLTAYI